MGPPALTGGRSAHTCRFAGLRVGFNGAAGSHRRKATSPKTSPAHPHELQWGRRLSPAEGQLLAIDLVPEIRGLQWGRRLSPAEGDVPFPESTRRFSASMGPPALTGGRLCEAHEEQASARASMGPPALTGGRPLCTSTPTEVWCGFNGAAGSHRRKAARSRPDPTRSKKSFNGAAGSHRRKAAHGSPLSFGAMSRFNGAAGSHRRKAPSSCSRARASGALQWGRRLSPAEGSSKTSPPASPPTCFNGAAGSHRRKARREHKHSKVADALQWGRRLSPAEGPGELPQCAEVETASMGPPALTGGRCSVPLPSRQFRARDSGVSCTDGMSHAA